MKVFYCPCPYCESGIVLPRSSALGQYKRLKNSKGVSEEVYERSSGKWPLTLACFNCWFCSEHEKPILGERGDLDADIKGKSVWPIEIKDSDPHYDQRQTVYAVALAGLAHDFVNFVNSISPSLKSYDNAGNPKPIRPEDVIVGEPFGYDF